MAWTKIPSEHHVLFHDAVPDDVRVETIKMFGGLAGMVNGHMFGGLWAHTAVVRLAEPDRQAVMAMPGGGEFDPLGKGRVMKEMALLPEAVFRDGAALRGWLEKALAYTATLPAKPPKTTAASKKKAASKKAAAPIAETATSEVAPERPPVKKAPGKKKPVEKKAPSKKKPVEKKAPSKKKPVEKKAPGKKKPVEKKAPGKKKPVKASAEKRAKR